jgi:phytoene desaturase
VKWDALVVGAGIGGLSAAVHLAAGGLRVRVLESAERPGGKAGSVLIDGVRTDTGPSVLTLIEVFEELFRRAGTRLEEEITLIAPDPAFRYLYPDGVVLDIYHHPEQTLESVQRTLGSEARQQLEAFLVYAARIWEAAAPAFVLGPAPTMGNLLKNGWRAAGILARIDPLRSMRSSVYGRVRSPHLRALLARYATYNGSDFRRAPATLNCIAHVELSLGSYGVKGGMYALVEALVRVAERLGVVISCGSPVERIEVSNGRVRGVRLRGGERIECERVIANADAARVAASLLPRDLRHGIVMDGPLSMSGYNAVFRARRRSGSERRIAHTVLFPRDYEQEFVDIFDESRPPLEPTVYLCAQEVCHQIAGWPEHEPVFAMANAPPLEETPDAGQPCYENLGRLVRERAQEAGLLDPGDGAVWERSPRDLAALYPFSRGSIYGLASNNRYAAFRRPPNVLQRVPGLFLASGSAHPGGGVPLAAISGRVAAQAALSAGTGGSPA